MIEIFQILCYLCKISFVSVKQLTLFQESEQKVHKLPKTPKFLCGGETFFHYISLWITQTADSHVVAILKAFDKRIFTQSSQKSKLRFYAFCLVNSLRDYWENCLRQCLVWIADVIISLHDTTKIGKSKGNIIALSGSTVLI